MVSASVCTALTDRSTSFLFVAFQVKRLPPGMSGGTEHSITVSLPPPDAPVMSQTDVHHCEHQGQLPLQIQPASQLHQRPQPVHLHSQLYHHQQLHAGPSSRAGEPAVVHSHRGSSLHLSADSACSSSSMPGRVPMFKPPTMPQWEEKCHPNVTSTGMRRTAGLTCSCSPLRCMCLRVGLGGESGPSLTDRNYIKQRLFSQLDYMQSQTDT